MKQTKEIFEEFISRKDKIAGKELDDFFADLDPRAINEMFGEWRVGYIFTEEREASGKYSLGIFLWSDCIAKYF